MTTREDWDCGNVSKAIQFWLVYSCLSIFNGVDEAIWNIPQRLICLNNWCLVWSSVWKNYGTFRRQPCWRKYVIGVKRGGFKAWPYSLFCLPVCLRASYMRVKCDLHVTIKSTSCCCCHTPPTMLECKQPSGTLARINHCFPNLL